MAANTQIVANPFSRLEPFFFGLACQVAWELIPKEDTELEIGCWERYCYEFTNSLGNFVISQNKPLQERPYPTFTAQTSAQLWSSADKQNSHTDRPC